MVWYGVSANLTFTPFEGKPESVICRQRADREQLVDDAEDVDDADEGTPARKTFFLHSEALRKHDDSHSRIFISSLSAIRTTQVWGCDPS